jgi:hypothetical protein
MRKILVAMRTILILSSIIAGSLACGGSNDVTDPTLTTTQPIINGNIVSVDNIGTPAIYNGIGNACTSTLLNSMWILTAHHCMTNEDVIIGGTPVSADKVIIRTEDGSQYVGARNIYLHPTLDVALVVLDKPITGFTDNSLYLGSFSDLVGQKIWCQGYGYDAFNASFGTLRSALEVVSQESDGYYSLVPNSLGQIDWLGDSGGSCFILDSNNNPTHILTGVQSSVQSHPYNDGGGDVVGATQIESTSIGKWIYSTMNPPSNC